MKVDLRRIVAFAGGIVILVAFLYAGNAISAVLHLPLPGSVLGMVMLAGALHLRVIRPEWVKPAAEPMIRHMSLLYIPPGVGVMAYFGLIRREWLPLVAAGVVGMLAVMLVVGLLQQRMERRG